MNDVLSFYLCMYRHFTVIIADLSIITSRHLVFYFGIVVVLRTVPFERSIETFRHPSHEIDELFK